MTTLPNLALTMIVKNESHVISKTLKNIIDHAPIQYWVILDTGSTDNTPDIITSFFASKNIPGELHKTPTNEIQPTEEFDFAKHRTKLFNIAFKKSKYVLMFDADDEIEGTFRIPDELSSDMYLVFYGNSSVTYERAQIFKNDIQWKYSGELHEYPESVEPCSRSISYIQGDYIINSGRTGHRNKNILKYEIDALRLEKLYEKAKQENNEIYIHYAFYCAQSWLDSIGYASFDYNTEYKKQRAIYWYSISTKIDTWDSRIYEACKRLFLLHQMLGKEEHGYFYLEKGKHLDNGKCEITYYIATTCMKHDMLPQALSQYHSIKKDYLASIFSPQTFNKQHSLIKNIEIEHFLFPFIMIVIAGKLDALEDVLDMCSVIMTKKYPTKDYYKITNFLYNVKFVIQHFNSTHTNLLKDYVAFISTIHDIRDEYEKFGCIFEYHGVPFPKKQEIYNTLSPDCENSTHILFYTGHAPFPWNYSYFTKNAVGGSETAVCELVSRLAFNNKHMNFYVSGEVIPETINNIQFIHSSKLQELLNVTKFHTIVVVRYINFYSTFSFEAFQTTIMAHDICLFAITPAFQNKDKETLYQYNNVISNCVCLTNWHRNLFSNIYPTLENKIITINNGIHTELFKYPTNQKQPNSFIYSSCSERGLAKVLQLWEFIITLHPDAKLFICSYNKFPSNAEELEMEKIIKTKFNSSISHLGKLNKPDLYQHMAKCEYWLYPSDFKETSCITAMEMLASEVICLYYPTAGLVDTLGEYGVTMQKDKEFMTLVNLMNDEPRKQTIKEKGKQYALSCDWKHRTMAWEHHVFHITKPKKNIPIKIINLPHRTDRKEFMEQQFIKYPQTQPEKYNISYEFCNAVDGKAISNNSLIHKLFLQNDFNYSPGAIGCMLSHLFIYEKLIRDNTTDFYVILEDDAIFTPDVFTKLSKVIDKFIQFNIGHLTLGEYKSKLNHHFPQFVCNTNPKNLRILQKNPYTCWNCTFAYIINKKTASAILKFANTGSLKCAFDNSKLFHDSIIYHRLNEQIFLGTEPTTDTTNGILSSDIINTPSPISQISTILKFKQVAIRFCHWWNTEYYGVTFDQKNNFFTSLLVKHAPSNYTFYPYSFTEPSPNDYDTVVNFYSIFKNQHQPTISKTKKTRNIFFSGEPIGQDPLADHNLTCDKPSVTNSQLPLWIIYHRQPMTHTTVRNKFCSFIATGAGLVPNRRAEFVTKLSQYKQVDCIGAFMKNTNITAPMTICGKEEINASYKFSIAFESADYPYYVSEKIYDIFLSGAIPIYKGTDKITEYFNPKCFINANNFNSIEDLVNFIIQVDNSPILYQSFFVEDFITSKWRNILNDPNQTYFKNIANQILLYSSGLYKQTFHKYTNHKLITNPQKQKAMFYIDPAFSHHALDDYIQSFTHIWDVSTTRNINTLDNTKNTIILVVTFDYSLNIQQFTKHGNSVIYLNSEPLNYAFHYKRLKLAKEIYNGVQFADMCQGNMIYYKKLGIQDAKYLPYQKNTNDKTLFLLNKSTPKIYDFGIISDIHDPHNMCSNRKRVVFWLFEKGYSIHIISGWGHQRDAEICKCHTILNIHGNVRDEFTQTFEELRCLRLLRANINIISESTPNIPKYIKNKKNIKFVELETIKDITPKKLLLTQQNINYFAPNYEYKPITCVILNDISDDSNILDAIDALFRSGKYADFSKIYIYQQKEPLDNVKLMYLERVEFVFCGEYSPNTNDITLIIDLTLTPPKTYPVGLDQLLTTPITQNTLYTARLHINPTFKPYYYSRAVAMDYINASPQISGIIKTLDSIFWTIRPQTHFSCAIATDDAIHPELETQLHRTFDSCTQITTTTEKFDVVYCENNDLNLLLVATKVFILRLDNIEELQTIKKNIEASYQSFIYDIGYLSNQPTRFLCVFKS